ncbi:MAG: hypothetical protein HZB41_08465 [Ignavibacteriae bacterium]|nr:hypothetical protein [Ignavibacteriota bacterium]
MRLVVFVLIILSVISLNAQLPGNGSIQVVVKGVITDEFTGEPCGTSITIKDRNGKKFKINSNSSDGTYEQVLTAGETYEFTFMNFDVLKKVENLYVEPVKKYAEQKADFNVKKLRQGLHLFSDDIFKSGETGIINNPEEILKKLEEILVYNRSAKFEFIATAHDTYSAPPIIAESTKTTKSKKSKNKTNKTFPSLKQQPEPEPNLVKLLVDSRMKAIEELTSGFMKRNKHRLSYRPDYTLAEPCSEATILSKNPDFIISVVEIKDAFE